MSNATSVSPEAPIEASEARYRCDPRPRRLRAVLSAVAATLAIWVIAVPVGGVDLAVRTGTGVQQVGPVPVVLGTVVAAVAGFAVLALLARRTLRARTIWTALAVGVFLLSLLGPLGAVSATAMVVLMAMHVTVAALVIVTGRCIVPVPPAGRG